MKASYKASIALALASIASGYALAADRGGRGPQYPEEQAASATVRSSAEVLAELTEAQRTGDLYATGNANSGKKLNEVFPSRYPAAQKAGQQLAADTPFASGIDWATSRGHGNSSAN